MRIVKATLLLNALLFFSTIADAQILASFETYKCEAFPSDEYSGDEAYYDMKKYGQPVPSSKVEALVADIYQRIEMDLALKITPSLVRINHIKKAISIYMDVDWFNIAGFLPWTVSHFIKSLGDEELNTLAIEVFKYIQSNGVFEIEEIHRSNNHR